MTGVVGLVLAAGAGRRFGGPKALAELDGERLVDRAVRTVHEGGVDRVYVVSGAVALQVAGAVVVDNPEWDSGMGSSLVAGLAALPEDAVAALVVLVDQPGLTAAAVARVVARADEAGTDTVAVATYDGQRRHPVALGRNHWPEVTRLASGDVGARPFLDTHPGPVAEVDCTDVADAADVDSPDDLESFRPG
ncbi:MAG: nucleotidyltransferase family protein [Actinomycetes bacterium]